MHIYCMEIKSWQVGKGLSSSVQSLIGTLKYFHQRQVASSFFSAKRRSFQLFFLLLFVFGLRGEKAYDVVHFARAVLVIHRILVLLLADVDVGVEALQDCQATILVDIHERRCQLVAHDENEYEEGDGLVDVLLETGHVGDDQIADASVGHANEDFPKTVNDFANTMRYEEIARVLQGQDAGLHSGRAEWLAVEDHHDISILIQELNEPMEAIQAASSARNQGLSDATFAFQFGDLVVEELESDPKRPDDGQKERSEGEGALVVSEGPPESLPEAEPASSVLR